MSASNILRFDKVERTGVNFVAAQFGNQYLELLLILVRRQRDVVAQRTQDVVHLHFASQTIVMHTPYQILQHIPLEAHRNQYTGQHASNDSAPCKIAKIFLEASAHVAIFFVCHCVDLHA